MTQNAIRGEFAGPVMLVNPKHEQIDGLPTYPDIASLPEPPDLALIATPPPSVPGIIGELGARGTRAAIVITAGLRQLHDPVDENLQQAMLDEAARYCLRIVGPNCLGVLVPRIGLNASFSHLAANPGELAFIAQSGAIITSVLDWAQPRGIGFSHLVSLGDMADVDFGDMLDYLANDRTTRAILLYIESITAARKFVSAARAAARTKPVIVVKAGRKPEGARAAASHTGALAGSDDVYDAVFRRVGVLRVVTLEELFDAVETLAMSARPKGDRLAILTNGGGIGVLATDALIEHGGQLAELSSETMPALNEVLPRNWSRGNPVDIIGDAPGKRYADTLKVLSRDKGIDAVLVLNCPTAVISRVEAARAVIDNAGKTAAPALLTSWVGDDTASESRKLFAEHRIPTYDTPEQAVGAFMHLVNYRRNQELLMETPPSVPEDFAPRKDQARSIIAGKSLGAWLPEHEAKAMLAAYQIPVVMTRIATTPEEAAAIAAEIGGPVALKIHSADIIHKSDVSGVALDLYGPLTVQETALGMLEHVKRRRPDATLKGFTVQPMVSRPGAYELIAGVINDPQFGPVILFGQGGTAVEVMKDKALGLPPLNMRLARELISRTRIFHLLKGYRGLSPVNLDSIALTLIRIAQLIIDIPDIAELDLNPLLADAYGVMALDARIRLSTEQEGPDRLAIRPYPKELEEIIPLGDGRALLLRPIQPEDEPSLQRAFTKLTPEEVRLRFMVPMTALSHVTAARFTQLDYDREMALVLTEAGIAGKTEIYGVVRLSADPDNECAEYAIIIRKEMTGMGLGILLMRRIINYAKSRGIGEIFGEVLRENTTMLKLCDALGFSRATLKDDPGIIRVTLKL